MTTTIQIGDDVEARLNASIAACAIALADLDEALHSMDLVKVQGRLASSMASQVILLRELSSSLYGQRIPEDPAQIRDALKICTGKGFAKDTPR